MKPDKIQTAVLGATLLVSLIFASAAKAQSFQSLVFVPVATSTAYTSTSSTGWETGSQTYTAVGLTLDWVEAATLHGGVPSDSYTYQITNVADLTSLDLNRYISYTFDPLAALGTSDYTLSSLNTRKTFSLLSPGENFEIRTSYNNFSAPLIAFEGADGTVTGTVAPDTIPTAPNIVVNRHAPTMTDTLTGPLEFRFYYYGTNLDGAPAVDTFGAAVGAGPYTISVAAVPEPTGALLLGVTGLLGCLRRRRAN